MSEQSFNDYLAALDPAALRERIEASTVADVERALARAPQLGEGDVAALLSPAAVPYIETMAQRAAALSQRRFGNTVALYTPLYLSNECVNKCTYCGFSHELDIHRITLSPAQVVAEADLLYDEGFRSILLVSGESRRHVGMDYLTEVVRLLRPKWDAIAIEIQPLKEDEYRTLEAEGVTGLAIYQETYDTERYKALHLAGPKRNFPNRIDAIERGGRAGFRSLGIASLLGLGDWRFEATILALHGRYLTRKFWQARIAVSFPRIRDAAACYHPDFLVSDRDLVQMICVMRLAMPDCELVISTREPAELRDQLVHLGINRMSAGSRTNPGGYSNPEDHSGEQFEISDERSPAEVAAMLAAKGYEPVWKDFDREFVVR